MPEYLHPGVYVSEVSGGSHTIQAASTSTACFIGESAIGRPFAPTLVTSFIEFSRMFGGLVRRKGGAQRDMPLSVKQFFENGGSRLYIVRVVAVDAALATVNVNKKLDIEAAGKGAWGNDLQVQFTQNAIDPTRIDVAVLQKQPSGTYAPVESFDSLSFDADKPKFYATIINRDSNYIHVPPDATGQYYEETTSGGAVGDLGLKAPKGSTVASAVATLAGGTDGTGAAITTESLDMATDSLVRFKDISILAVPGVYKDNLLANVTAWVQDSKQQDMILILDGPGDQHNLTPEATQLTDVKAYQKTVTNNEYGALYWPWIEVPDPYTTVTGATRFAPPSGFIAGLYARTDNSRGVWKAPAGTEATIMGAVGVAVDVSDVDQDTLNPYGINCIRKFDAAGIVCWGARTLATPDSEYLYVPVRRTAIYLRKSLYSGTQWVVFEPNDAPLWRSITDNVDAFMSIQFRSGAFQGGSPKEAYFVLCDSTNNYQATIDAGQVHIKVGFAPLKPAEFVIIELTQIHQES